MRFIGDRPQSEAACLIVAGAFQPPVVEHQHFGMPHFQKQLAIIGIDKGVADNGLGRIAVERAAAEEDVIGGLEMVHIVLFPALVVPFLDESLMLRMGRCGPDFKRQGSHLRGAGATCRGLVKIRREFF